MKKIILLLVPLIALIGGAIGGDMLRAQDQLAPDYAEAEAAHDGSKPHPERAATADHGKDSHSAGAGSIAIFTFPTQFFVPLMRNGDMGGMMIVTLSLETTGESLSAMQQQEHRLRDALLRQLMVTANSGGFDGNFTVEGRQRPLRDGLLKAAKSATDLPVTSVLIEDIARQNS